MGEEEESDIESEHLKDIPVYPVEITSQNLVSNGDHDQRGILFTNKDSLSTSRNLISQRNFKLRQVNITRKESLETQQLNINQLITQKDPQLQEQDILLRDVEEITLHQSSQGNKNRIGHVKLCKDFERAVSASFIPKYFKSLVIALYMAFISIIVCQTTLHLSISNDLKTLEVRKTIMKLSAARTLALTSLYGVNRNLWVYAMGRRNESNFPENFRPPYYWGRLQTYVQDLTKANKNMIVTMDTLDATSREQLMQNDVRMFDTNIDEAVQKFMNMTSFQATDKIIENSLRAFAVGTISLPAAVPQFNITLRNAMNDLLVVSENLGTFLADSIEKQSKLILERNSVNFAVNMGVLGLLFILFCYSVAKQYRSETRNMNALGKIEGNEAIKLMGRAIIFQLMLQEEEEFGFIQNLETYGSSAIKPKELYELSKSQANNKDTRNHGLKGITKIYQLYPAKLVAYIFVVTVLILTKFLIIGNFISNIRYVVDQIFFPTTINPKLLLVNTITLDMTGGCNSTIRNLPMLDQFNQGFDLIQNATQRISGILKSRDQTYDPVIQAILFDNACDYTTPHKTVDAYCQQLKQISQNMGLIEHMANYQNILINFKDAYEESDKSLQALAAIDIDTLTSRTQSMLLISNILNVISGRLDNKFYEIVDQGEISISLINHVLISLLVITGLLLHIRLINDLMQSENRFRNVLKLFPARVILSNFVLKTYLTKTWKGSLASAKLIT